MKATSARMSKLRCLFSVILAVFLVAPPIAAKTAAKALTADQCVSQARQRVVEKDYAKAAVLYQQALKLDQTHSVARHELKQLLLESRRLDPESEFSEAEWALIEKTYESKNDANVANDNDGTINGRDRSINGSTGSTNSGDGSIGAKGNSAAKDAQVQKSPSTDIAPDASRL